jgi:hypothetical protein
MAATKTLSDEVESEMPETGTEIALIPGTPRSRVAPRLLAGAMAGAGAAWMLATLPAGLAPPAQGLTFGAALGVAFAALLGGVQDA